MKLSFFKMQAQGNDYLYFDYFGEDLPHIDYAELSKHICDRHYGVGADGIVLLHSVPDADVGMRIFNADGSEAEMCGSALRSVCGYMGKRSQKEKTTVSTLSGIKEGFIENNKGRMKVKVDMGIPKVLNSNLLIAGTTGIHIDMGNPHFVVFVDVLPGVSIADMARSIYQSEHFPKGINVEFVRIDTRSRVTVQVWERGSGATLACGTGACAVAYAGFVLHKCDACLDIDLPGGAVKTEYNETNKHIHLTGEVVHVFDGTYEW